MTYRRSALETAAGALLLVAWMLPAAAAGSDLVLKRVMLSSGGVGYFEFEAEVDGAPELGLDVPLGQVDDVLESLVVYDSAGGIGGLDLPARDETHAAFGEVPFGPEALQSPLAYLNALHGVEIEVEGPKPVQGRILHAETVETGPSAQHTLVTVLTDDGLRQFVLEEADSVQVTDPALRAGIGKALDELRRASSRDMRHLTLHTTGTGHRIVRVGYVVAAPLWKATYRLVLPQPGDTKARLQGWAVLENDSGVDWSGVELTLQSGNPVTFRQALYETYYVQRPEVPVEVLGRLLPPVDMRSVQVAAQRAKDGAPPQLYMPAPEVRRNYADQAFAPAAALAAPSNDVAAADEGEAVTFRLPNPVVLPAAHTASVPILDHAVAAERLDLAAGNAAHPLASVRLSNDSGVALPAGVLTLYAPGDAARFVGDARLGGLPDGEKRLISFAEDLKTGVERHVEQSRRIGSLSAAGGVVRLEEVDRQTLRIRLAAPAKEKQPILLEIPKDGDRTLSVEGGQSAPAEETATAWRLPLTLKPGEVQTIAVDLDRIVRREVTLSATNPSTFLDLADEAGLSPPAHLALQHLAELEHGVTAQTDKLKQLDDLMAGIDRDEQRLRQNLNAVPPTDALHTRLLRLLEGDEDRLGGLRHDREQIEEAAEKARKDLAHAIETLSL